VFSPVLDQLANHAISSTFLTTFSIKTSEIRLLSPCHWTPLEHTAEHYTGSTLLTSYWLITVNVRIVGSWWVLTKEGQQVNISYHNTYGVVRTSMARMIFAKVENFLIMHFVTQNLSTHKTTCCFAVSSSSYPGSEYASFAVHAFIWRYLMPMGFDFFWWLKVPEVVLDEFQLLSTLLAESCDDVACLKGILLFSIILRSTNPVNPISISLEENSTECCHMNCWTIPFRLDVRAELSSLIWSRKGDQLMMIGVLPPRLVKWAERPPKVMNRSKRWNL